MIHPSDQEPFAPIIPLIGREDEKRAIWSAISNMQQQEMLYFVGSGGVGKSYLLREIEKMQGDKELPPFVWTGLIDLYHTNYHSPGGVREAIAKRIDPEGRSFREYKKVREEYLKQQKEGIGGRELEAIRQKQDDQFQKDYARFANQRRVVLCFDTMELLQYESDIVLEICDIEKAETVVKQWILSQVTQFPNTVVIFAGRPNEFVEADFTAGFEAAGWNVQKIQLENLKKKQTLEYLSELSKKHSALQPILMATTSGLDDKAPKIQDWVYEVTDGRPIRLTLMADLLLHGDVVGNIFNNVDEKTIDARLIDRLRQLQTPYGQLVTYLLFARKGLDTILLKALAGDTWTDAEVKLYLQKMREFAFVKTHPDHEDVLFLHDEIYDIYDLHFRNIELGGYEPIAAYYRQKLQDETLNKETRKELMIASLYYEFQLNSHHGYHTYYARWDEDAIVSYDIGLDMRLRDEGLLFMNRYALRESRFFDERVASVIARDVIDRDCAVRWVKRYISRGDLKKAREVAENIRKSDYKNFDWDIINDPIYKAGLLSAWGETILYFAPDEAEKAKEMFAEAIKLVEAEQGWDKDQLWWRARILGKARNNLGYLHRSRGRYGLALQEYRKALPYFNQAGVELEWANTSNNMAYLLVLLGRVTLAERHGNKALAIRKKIGQKYPLALSCSTLGLIHILQDHPIWAEKYAKDALEYLKDTSEQSRGHGLVYITYGLLLRKRGDQWKKDVFTAIEAEKDFQDSQKYFEKARSIFSSPGTREPLRLWEVLNELGSLYCDWGWQAWRQTGNKSAAVGRYEQAIQFQTDALDTALINGLSFQAADSYDDLAQAHADLSFLLWEMGKLPESQDSRAQAEKFLGKVALSIPETFSLQPNIGFQTAPEPGEAYWLSLGKYYLWKSTWMLRDMQWGIMPQTDQPLKIDEALKFLILSAAYFQQYWPQSFALNHSVNYFGNLLEYAQGWGKTATWANNLVTEIEQEYSLELNILKETISDLLGN